MSTKQNIENVCPLAPVQQGMLVHSLSETEERPYLQQLVFTLHGELEAAALERAWQTVVGRHSALRAFFVWDRDREPVQVVLRQVELPWEAHDWRGVPPEVREERLRELLRRDVEKGFNLAKAPLMRLCRIRLGDREHKLVWSFHHLLLDGWSSSLVLQEVFACYDAFVRGREPRLAPARPYSEYLAWRQRQDAAAAEAFWRRELAGVTAPTPLAPVGSAAAGLAAHGDVELEVAGPVFAGLEALARRNRLTVGTFVQAAWALLLARSSGQDDVVFGLTVAGRPADLEGVTSMVGLFINTLPLRVRIAPDRPLRSWLQEIQAAQLRLQRYDFSSLVDVQGWSEVPRGLPLFESILAFEGFHVGGELPGTGGLEIAGGQSRERTNYPLTLMAGLGRTLSLRLVYDARRFGAPAMLRLLGHLAELLARMIQGIETPLSEILPLTTPERHQVQTEWNDSRLESPAQLPPHTGFLDLFEAWARLRPDAVAAVCAGEQLTWRELDGRAERLARALAGLGVEAETVVAVLADRGIGLLTAMLALFKAGGVYLPLDPRHPAHRHAQILRESRARLVLAADGYRPVAAQAVQELPEEARPLLTALDDPAPGVEAEPRRGTGPDGLAYVIYTSGSTGLPKGAMVVHRGMLNHLRAKIEDLALGPGDLIAQTAPQCFDISIWQLLVALAVGGRVEIFPDEVAQNPARLLRAVETSGMTILETVPSLLRIVIEEAEGSSLPALRWMIPTGEALPPDLCRRWLELFPRIPLVNAYGPTECSDDVSHHPVRSAPAAQVASIPIGRPVANTRLHVVDHLLQPQPMEIAGELCVGGDGVGRGYLRDPLRTAGVFVPDPFSAQPGSRLYRTGDLARWLPDGTLEFLGRIDHQVKIRGLRIELGEIEAVLSRHPGVREAVVLAVQGGAGDQRLVACVVPRAAGLTAAVLEEHLRESLPEYMVPAGFALLETMPLNPSGKVDRKALARLDEVRGGAESATSRSWVAPRNPVEELLAGIFAQVLRLERVGAEDEFFALGGHSLLATQVASRVRRALGVELPLRALFEAPTVAALAARVEVLLRGRGPEVPPLVPVPRSAGLPLSFAQERLWFLAQLDPGSSGYNVPLALELRGALDLPALGASLSAVVARHEALHTTFAAGPEGRPSLRIAPPRPVVPPLVDLAGLPPERASEVVRAAASEEAERPFDLERGPLLRATLLRLAPERHVALLTLHHIVSDGWSMGVLVREIGALYAALSRGRRPELPELPVQYVDFAAWQRLWLSGEALAAQLAWWRQSLAGAPEVIDLPLDRPRPAVRSARGGRVPVRLPAGLSRALAAFGRAQGATPFMVLLAAFQGLLARLSGQDDVVVGSPVANRTRVETEGLIGFFVNTLALRTELAGAPTFAETVARVRETTLGAYAHQDLPFEKLVEELRPERSLAHAPLFQVMLVLQNAPAEALELPGLTLEPLDTGRASAKFDITLALDETEDGFAGSWVYSPELFDAPTAARLAEHFERLLAAAVETPDARLADLPVTTEAQRHQILGEWNDTEIAEKRPARLHELVRAQVARTPDAVAAETERETLTYRELARRAGEVAGRLRSLGVTGGAPVGIAMERSLEMAVAALGVLEAGGAYVPLDPEYPRERLARILCDAKPPVVLTQTHLVAGLPALGGRVLCLDGDGMSAAEEAGAAEEAPEAFPTARAADPGLACILFTSGSTGRPKGVMVRHRGLVNRILWAQRTDPLDGSDRVLQNASFSFDFSIWEIFAPLVAGARVVLPKPGGHRESAYLARLIAERGVTAAHFVPSMLRVFLDEDLSGCDGLRIVYSGGEALFPDVEALCLARLGRALLRNQYGPTEASIDVTHWLCRSEPGASTVPIGRPIDNTRAVVLDRRAQPVPLGVAGELCVGGEGLARGYFGRPDLTADRFVPDAWSPRPGERLYRTGDLARLRADGAIEYLGRVDHQVKIRGFRIEPGEIEAVLGSHPGVREAAVVVREDGSNRRLVGYVAAAPDLAGELRTLARERLPEYMVPAAIVPLPELPRTPSGKVDRQTLARSGPLPETAPAAPARPRTPVEELLAGMFADVLGLERVGVDEGFFDLGGHSLLATRLAARVRSAFGVELPLRTLFEAPTVEALAGCVQDLLARDGREQAPPLRPVARTAELPLSYAQERLWFLHRLAPESPSYNMPTALELRGRLDRPALAASLSWVAARHEVLRTTFRVVAGRPVPELAPALDVVPPVADLAALPAERREAEALRLAREEAARPFDLAAGPLLRATLLRLAEERHIALLTLHHIVSDGWSTGVLVREVASSYEAFSQGRRPALPELPVQYADYAAWQRQWLAGEVLERQLAWWRESLAGAPAVLDLPLDRPRPTVQTFRGAHVPLRLSRELSRGLDALGRGLGATPFMLLLAGFQALLSRLSGQEDVVVGSPVANRDRLETEGLIGFFVNTLALRGDLTGDPSFAELVARARERALGAYAHQDLPFEKLVAELAPQRDLGHAPLFQVMLVFQNAVAAGARTLALPGLTIEPVAAETGAASFDLTLSLGETPEGLAGSWEHNLDLLDTATVERISGCFATLLAGALENPAARLSDLPLLAEIERRQILAAWDRTGEGPAPAATLPEVFAARAARTPEAVAAAFAGAVLTYGELERRANQLARSLQQIGVVPGDRVGLCVERSFDLLVAILGIWKAGAAFLPLDPAYPQDRLAFMVEDGRPAVVLAQEGTAGSLPAGTRLVRLDAGRDAIERASAEAAVGAAVPEAPAYVIYTSGSTGRPKGVMVPHRGLANLAEAQLELFGLEPGDRVLQFSSPSFDAAVWDVAMALRSGATLVLAPRRTLVPGPELVELLRGVTAVTLPPSALAVLPTAAAAELAGLRTLVVASEACPPEVARRWAAGRRLFNGYGPTEASVCVTAALYDGGDRLPLGRPLPNVEILVLDRWGNPVPVGIAGELLAGGLGLAHGYLGRPELTAERFVPHPFSAVPGARLYRTGDLVRLLPSGELQFLGRIDHQVKLRGFRIELGEIEAALAAQPEVREAVVVVRDDLPGGRGLVAYVAPADGRDVVAGALRERLRELLPDSMVPAHVVTLPGLQLPPNGKVDRRALPAPVARPALPAPPEASFVAPGGPLQEAVAAIWREVLGLERIGAHDNFFDLGGHSLLLARVHERLRESLGLAEADLSLVDLFTCPTVATLAEHLRRRRAPAPPEPAPAAPVREAGEAGTAIAVIGMALRVPGASNPEELWDNLSRGVESIRRFTDEELLAAGVSPELLRHPGYVKARGSLEGVELFDAAFFRISPRQAALMDPQHRIFLECAWEALESAGHAAEETGGSIGLYAGSGTNTYAFRFHSHPELVEAAGYFQTILANEKDHLATQTAYLLGLEGPSVAVQTACSTSLVAVHLACQALLQGDCDMALAGGVSVEPQPRSGYLYQEGGIVSPDGRCRPFDADANGTVGGSGAGIVVLKRLADALRDGDAIRAVIRGSAVNNDGSRKVGYTAPRLEGQARVVRAAQLRAGVRPEEISYVEAHGTGTELGDPIELAALTRAFRAGTDATGFCAVGALKSNLGHLDTASGVAGLIKTVLALEHEAIPPTLHFERPNPQIDFAGSPFYVNTRLREWRRGEVPRRAGVSSFGIGGTNAHVVLEEAPALPASGPSRTYQLLTLSARTATALETLSRDLARFLRSRRDVSLADVAHTLQTGRRVFPHRRTVLCRDLDEAVAALEGTAPAPAASRHGGEEGEPFVLLFPGQGTQQVDMGRELYDTEPVFRREIDRAAEILRPLLGLDLREILHPAAERAGEAAERLASTAFAQPALFAVEHALARLWMSWTGDPEAMLGHSLGEYVAACLAGVFSLEDALALVVARGRLMEETEAGAMLAVPLSEEQVLPLLGEELSLAAVNGPARCVVAGPVAAVTALEESLGGRGISCRRLHTERAFHARSMEPVLERFTREVERLRLAPPRIPFLSNFTGTWITDAQATSPAYWAEHLRRTVRFDEGLRELWRSTRGPVVEAGPGNSLTALASQHPDRPAGREVLPLMRHPREHEPEQKLLLARLGQAWLAGVKVDWQAFSAGEVRRRLPLPTYPFERRRHWIDDPGRPAFAAGLGEALARHLKLQGHEVTAEECEQALRAILAAEDAAAEDASAAETAAGQAPARTVSEPPATDAEKEIAGIWRDLLGVEIGRRDDFFELGGDSLIALQVTARIREAMGVDLPLRRLLEAPTVASLARLVEDSRPRAATPEDIPEDRPTLVEIQAGQQGRLPFFAVHATGGNVLSYANVARSLGSDRPLYALQAPGLEGERMVFTRLEDLAAHHVETIRQIQPEGPYLLGGWSTGGAVAFEMARQLRAAGQEVGLVALIDSYAPRAGGAMDETKMLMWQAWRFRLHVEPEELERLGSLDDRLRLLVDRAVAAGVVPPHVSTEQAFRLLQVEVANLRAILGYTPGRLDGNLVYFRCTERTDFGEYSDLFFSLAEADHASAWGRLCAAARVYDVPADHATVLEEPAVRVLGRHLAEEIDRSERASLTEQVVTVGSERCG